MSSKQFIVFIAMIFSVCFGHTINAKSQDTKSVQPQKNNLNIVRNCGDWSISIISQTDNAIKVEDCAWGMGWSCNTYDMPKTVTQ